MEREDLQAAEAHIARLEHELLRLKDVNRELQKLRQEHQILRRSAAGRMAKLLTLPWRLFSRTQRTETALTDYERWFARHRVASSEFQRLRQQADNFSYRPLVSILMPTFNSKQQLLQDAVESVVSQIYDQWELIIVDDASDEADVRRILRRFAERDQRVRVFFDEEHRGISAALNAALSRATGEWLGLLDHDDVLEPDALFRVIELLQKHRESDVIYSDEDKIMDGHFASPMFKPDWSPELFLTHDYLGHFIVVQRELVKEGFRSEFDGAQDYDLLLRIREKTDRVRHIPRVLYHWRRTAESTAHNIRRKPGALEAGRRALDEHLARTGIVGYTSIDWETHTYRVRLKGTTRTISILLLGGNEDEVAAVRDKTAYEGLEIIAATATARASPSGEYLLFLDSHLEPSDCAWLTQLAEQLNNSEVGAVGGRIVNSNGIIENAGYVLLPDATARPAFNGFSQESSGINRQLKVVRNYSAVTASCLLTRRELFERVTSTGMLGFLNFAETEPVCAGVEYCLKLRDAGLRVVTTPYATLQRRSLHTSVIGECPELANRWSGIFRQDPFYNPNLATDEIHFSLASKPRE